MSLRISSLLFAIGCYIASQLESVPATQSTLLLILSMSLAGLFWRYTRYLSCLLLGFMWLLIRVDLLVQQQLPAELEGKDLIVQGQIVSMIQGLSNNGRRFLFKPDWQQIALDKQEMPKLLRLGWYQQAPQLLPGQYWQLRFRLKQPFGFSNPGGFDYEGWLFQNSIRATGYIRLSTDNQFLGQTEGQWVNRIRQEIQKLLHKGLENHPMASMIPALAIGDKQAITTEDWQVFQRSGVAHLMAISGLHIGLVAAFGLFIGRWSYSLLVSTKLQIVPAQQVGLWCGFAVAVFYSALAGFTLPTQRALIMIAIVFLLRGSGRRGAFIDQLLLAMLGLLVWDPLSINNAGFYLSFGAVFLIIFGCSGRAGQKSRWWRYGRTSVIVSIGLLPILVIHFGQHPLWSPVANMLAVPWVSLTTIPLVLLGTLCATVSDDLARTLWKLAADSLLCIWPFLQWISNLPYAKLSLGSIDIWKMLLTGIGILILMLPAGIPARWLGLFCLLPAVLHEPQRPEQNTFIISLLDVGQGLSAVIETQQHLLVFDTGAKFSDRFNTGEAVIAPFLASRAHKHIDMLVISHGDNDHIGGAEGLRQQIDVKRILTSVPERFVDADDCDSQQAWLWDGVMFEIIYPPPGSDFSGNNASCVLRVSTGGHAVLLTGDIERKAERRLLNTQTAALRADIIVVPHHGSQTSSSEDFIDKIQPEIALFPVGYRNRYHFPAKEIMKRYHQRQIETHHSFACGTMSFLVSQESIRTVLMNRPENLRLWHRKDLDC